MSVSGLDHVSIATARPEDVIRFYTALGLAPLGVEEWRLGRARSFSFAFGDAKLNVHPPGVWQDPRSTLRGRGAEPGCGDLCFVWAGSVRDAQDRVLAAGGELLTEPVQRTGGRAGGTATGTSVYTRDPDGTLLEFITYG